MSQNTKELRVKGLEATTRTCKKKKKIIQTSELSLCDHAQIHKDGMLSVTHGHTGQWATCSAGSLWHSDCTLILSRHLCRDTGLTFGCTCDPGHRSDDIRRLQIRGSERGSQEESQTKYAELY